MTTPGADRRVVGGRYRLDSPIGRGGAGVVWCGEDELLQRPVAVKEIILVPFAGTQQDREAIRSRVLREARALARLHSSAIVTVFDVVEEAHRHWIVMELVDADSLGDVIRTDGPLPPARVAAIGLALTEALGAAHAAGVLHRDIKPGNILLAGDGRVRLTDFGIAAIEGDTTLTATGTLMGSPGYIAPERVRGSSGSPASDLWGLAATLYAAVEGHPPFEGPETYAVLAAVVEGRRRPFELAGPLESLLGALLDRAPADRPSLVEVRRRLRPIAGTTKAVPEFVSERPPARVDVDEVDALAVDTAPAPLRGEPLVTGTAAPEREPVGSHDAGGRRGLLLASAAAAAVIGAALALSGVLTSAGDSPAAAAAAAPATTAVEPFPTVAGESTTITSTAEAVSHAPTRTTNMTASKQPVATAPPQPVPTQGGDPTTEPARQVSTPPWPTASGSSVPPEGSRSPTSPTSPTSPRTSASPPPTSPSSPRPTNSHPSPTATTTTR